MDNRSPKRLRQQEHNGNIACYNGGASGGGGVSSKQIPAGCYLEIRPASSHIFLGQPVEVEVRLLNDEDVVQPMTMGINASVISEDGNPDRFQLTPTRPALLDGTSTFQLILEAESVRTGSRVKIHVEASVGGREVKADSHPLMVCRSALNVVKQPPENWYKDEGGRNNCIEIEVQVREKMFGSPHPGQPQRGVQLTLALVYDSGTEVHTQEILQVQSDTQLITNDSGRANLKFKITEVSQRHQSQKFRVKISPDVKNSPMARDVAPVTTVPIQVLSKRKNRKIRDGKQAQSGHSPVYDPATTLYPGRMPTPSAVTSVPPSQGYWGPHNPLIGHPHASIFGHPSTMATAPPASIVHATPASKPLKPMTTVPQPPVPQPPVPQPHIPQTSPSQGEVRLRVPIKDARGSLEKVFKWVDAVLQLLQMELQWEHIGYEREEDGTVSYTRPLWRCPVCRTCKGNGHPHQKHSADCRLGGLLNEFENYTKGSFDEVARDYAAGESVGGRAGGGHRGGSGGGVITTEGESLARPGFHHMNGNSSSSLRAFADFNVFIGDTTFDRSLANGPGSLSIGDSDRRDDSRSYNHGAGSSLPLAQLPNGSSPNAGLVRGASGVLQNFLSLQAGSSYAGDGMLRNGSVAFFVPRRTILTPAEEKARFIMLASMDGGGNSGSGSGSGGKRLTVFSQEGTLLGVYEEKVDGDQPNLLLNEKFIPSFTRSMLEEKLAQAIIEDSDNAGSVGTGPDGSANGDRGATEMEAHASDALANRDVGKVSYVPGMKPASKPGTSGVKEEFGKMLANGEAGGSRPKGKGSCARGVYRLHDFKDYHDMKEKAFLDSLAHVDTDRVF